MAENKGQIQEEVKDSTSGNQSEGKNGKEKKPKKEKKKMNLHTKLVLVEAALVLIGLGIFFILLAATDGAGGAIFGGIIAAVIFIGIAVFIAGKNSHFGIIRTSSSFARRSDYFYYPTNYIKSKKAEPLWTPPLLYNKKTHN